MAIVFHQKNIEKSQRNGKSPESRTVVKYITQTNSGVDGYDSYNVILSPQVHVYTAGPVYATDGQTDRVNVLAFRGPKQINTSVTKSEITGLVQGIDASIEYNGTNMTAVVFSVSSTLSQETGQVTIPVHYNVTSTDSSTVKDSTEWSDAEVIATSNQVYSWTLAKSSTSLWVLDLTNETAKINADSSGNIDASAYRPECQARLAFGADNELEGVYYSVSTGDASVQGVGVNHSTGELILDYNNVPFQFGDLDNTILEIRFDASYEGTVRGSKVMTIEKSLPGQSGPAGSTPYIGDDGYWYIDGQSLNVKAEGENGTTPHIGPNGNWWLGSQDTGVKAEGTEGAAAVTRWISLSADQVKVDASNNVIPNKIYATAYKQTGGETPTTDSSTVIKWAHDSSTTSTVYTSSGVSVTSTWNYLTFKLYDEDGSTYLGESETVPVLRDGKNGEPGSVGPRGAIIRGPVEWDPSVVRRYCSGAQNGSDSQYHPEDASYIDIVLKDSSLYQCITSFTQNTGDAWKGSTYWQPADIECNFIATKLLLAKNAKIDFLTGNELYLTDADGHISGGGRAAGNGSDVIFWAGSDASTGNINKAQFQVDYQGNLKATSGTFSGFVQMPYINVKDLSTNLSGEYVADSHAYLISYPDWYTQQTDRTLVLPDASANLNGFMYDIIVYPRLSAAESYPNVFIRTVNDEFIYCVAYAELRISEKFNLTYGRYTITCVPFYGGTDSYSWFITSATGGIEVVGSNYTDYVSTLVASSTSTSDIVYRVQTYTGSTAPSTPNSDNTIFIQK